MKGAMTDPCAKINKPPNSTITIMMGASQSFLRARKNAHISFKNDIMTRLLN